MLKKTITFTDFNGDKQTEDYYFNLSKAELVKLELGQEGGYSAAVQKIIESEDNAQIISLFETIISMSVGERSEDGRRFRKSPEISSDFLSSPAYEELFFELLSDEQKAVEFIKSVIPPSEELSKMTSHAKEEKKEGVALHDNTISSITMQAPSGSKLASDMSVEELTRLIDARKLQG